ncbi:MAG: hypothetical protein MJE77_41860 [Proteobacteria bacterium]|nr:hypothetical protein [Pseudomonadota bacterium]
MLFLEEYARLLLVLHMVLAAALVAVSTHLVVWMRGFLLGRFQRVRAVRRFAWMSASLFAIVVLLGNAIYPVYKVRVRAEYLDQPDAIMRDYRDRLVVARQVKERYYRGIGSAGASRDSIAERAVIAQASHLPHQAAKIARWFDVKEHWVALGMALSIACAVVLLTWNPKKHGRAIASVAFIMAFLAALSVWLGAIIGVVVSSYRSIGGLG